MRSKPQSYEGVALVAPVSVPYVRHSDHGAAYFIGRALKALIDATGLEKSDVDGLAVASFSLAPDSAVALSEHFGLRPRFLEHVPMGGASGIVSLRRAARAVQAGDADVVACIGGDTLAKDGFADLIANFSRFSTDAIIPYGAAGPNGVFAGITQNYMARYSVTREDFGRICLSQRRNAQSFPHALLQKPLTMEDYLNARPIAGPLHLFDCVMPCAGADGFLVMSSVRAKKLGLAFAEILSAAELHNADPEDPVATQGGWAQYRDTLYEAAGRGPQEMDFLQTYDDYPVIVMMQIEDLGFCAKGAAARFVRETSLDVEGGGLPHNTSGGQLSRGQAGAAGGFLGLVEGLRQVTGQALGAAIPNARTGLVSGYGMVNYDRCLATAAAVIARGTP